MMKRIFAIGLMILAVAATSTMVLVAQGDGQGQNKVTICHVSTAGHDGDYCGECNAKFGEGQTMTIPRVAAENGHGVVFDKKGCRGGPGK